MGQQEKSQFGDGNDNFAGAASQMAKAARSAGGALKAAGQQAAGKGAEAAVNAAAASVNAGIQAGKAAANIAAGTAAGGPWGAIISAAWSMRHTLLKVLVCVGLFLLLIVVIVISLPSIIFQSLFESNEAGEAKTVQAVYEDLSDAIHEVLDASYFDALARAKDIIEGGEYDQSYSMNEFRDESGGTYEVGYILAAYSASMQQDANKADMIEKLNTMSESFFPITSEERTGSRLVIEDGEIKEIEFVYVVCTVHALNNDTILEAFGVDKNAPYGTFGITYGAAIDAMSSALKNTLNGG